MPADQSKFSPIIRKQGNFWLWEENLLLWTKTGMRRNSVIGTALYLNKILS